jgi:hypothetical protein
MTPYYYKIQRIVDGISGEVLSQEVLDTVQSPVEQPSITLFNGDIVELIFLTPDEYTDTLQDFEFRKAQSLESWKDEDSVSFPDPCEANE